MFFSHYNLLKKYLNVIFVKKVKIPINFLKVDLQNYPQKVKKKNLQFINYFRFTYMKKHTIKMSKAKVHKAQ